MHEEPFVLFLFVSLTIYTVLAIWVGLLASDKGRDRLMWTILSLVTSPVLAFLALLVVGESAEKKELAHAERLLNERAMKKILDEGFNGPPEALIAKAKSRHRREREFEDELESAGQLGRTDATQEPPKLSLGARVALIVFVGFIVVAILWPIIRIGLSPFY